MYVYKTSVFVVAICLMCWLYMCGRVVPLYENVNRTANGSNIGQIYPPMW